MTNQEFIQTIAPYCQKYAQKYGFKVASPAIAQACLESAYGTSNKAKHYNFFGLKYRPGRVSCNNGNFIDGSQEQIKTAHMLQSLINGITLIILIKGVVDIMNFSIFQIMPKLKMRETL